MFDNIINEDFLPPDDSYEDDENCNSDSSSDEEDNNANLDDKNEDPKDDPSDSDGEKHNKPNIIKDANKKKVKYQKKMEIIIKNLILQKQIIKLIKIII